MKKSWFALLIAFTLAPNAWAIPVDEETDADRAIAAQPCEALKGCMSLRDDDFRELNSCLSELQAIESAVPTRAAGELQPSVETLRTQLQAVLRVISPYRPPKPPEPPRTPPGQPPAKR